MNYDLAQEAISKALSGDWRSAIAINKKILSLNPENIDALNRISRAYAENGNFSSAKKYARRVLKIDSFNPIATKQLRKWNSLKKTDIVSSKLPNPKNFLEEPGKTKILALLYPGDYKLLCQLDSGDQVKLSTHSHRISVLTQDGKYIGRLPDDLSARLKQLITLGNEYQVYIKSIDRKDVKIFIREETRAPKLADIPSFSTEKIEYISFTPPELVHKKEEVFAEETIEEE